MRSRIRKLAAAVRARTPPPAAPLDEDGWLAAFAGWGRAGWFAREPDFPAALVQQSQTPTGLPLPLRLHGWPGLARVIPGCR